MISACHAAPLDDPSIWDAASDPHRRRAARTPMVVLIREQISDFRLGMRKAAQRPGRAASHGGLLPGSPIGAALGLGCRNALGGHFGPQHPQSRGEGRRCGASALSPTRARGDRGDNTPSSSTSRSAPRARWKPGRGGAQGCSPTNLSGSVGTGPAWAVTGQLWGW
jgi:hypothetical protein